MATFYRTYTIRFDANGGSSAPGALIKTESVVLTSYPGSVTVSQTISGSSSRTGYTFLGWSTSASATSASYQPGSTLNHTWTINSSADAQTGSYSQTLYAVWKAITYTVQYRANGGDAASVPSNQTKQYGVSLKLSSKVPTYTGRNFVGWNTAADGSGTSYAAGATYTANSSATLYAQWSQVTYPVTYNANGGTGAPAPQTKTHGTALTLSNTKPTREGYAFVSWNTAADSSGTTYAPGASYTVNAALSLYAVWHKLATLTITAADSYITTARTVSITKASAGDKVKVTAVVGTSGTLTLYEGTASSFTWDTSAYGSYISTAMSGTVTLTAVTYSGATELGSRQKSYTLKIPSYFVTIGAPVIEEHNDVPFAFFVQNRSAIDFRFATSTEYGATIVNRTTNINSETKRGASFTTGTLTEAGEFTYTITATDSRGASDTRTGTYTVEAYADPSATVSVKRGTADDTTATITLKQTHTTLSGNNPLQYTVEYKRTTAGSYTTVSTGTITAASNTTTYALTGLEAGGAYSIRVTVEDAFETLTLEKVLSAADTVVIRAQVSDHSLHFPNHTVFEKSYEIAEGAYKRYVELDTGDDLNDLLAPGSYKAASNEIAASLSNSPTVQSFVMTVENSRGEEVGSPRAVSSIVQRMQTVRDYFGNTYRRRLVIPATGAIEYYPWKQDEYADGTTAAALFADSPTLTAVSESSTVRAHWDQGYVQYGKLTYVAATATTTVTLAAGEQQIGILPRPSRLVALSVAAVGSYRSAMPVSVTVRTNGGIYLDHPASIATGAELTITGVYMAQ